MDFNNLDRFEVCGIIALVFLEDTKKLLFRVHSHEIRILMDQPLAKYILVIEDCPIKEVRGVYTIDFEGEAIVFKYYKKKYSKRLLTATPNLAYSAHREVFKEATMPFFEYSKKRQQKSKER